MKLAAVDIVGKESDFVLKKASVFESSTGHGTFGDFLEGGEVVGDDVFEVNVVDVFTKDF